MLEKYAVVDILSDYLQEKIKTLKAHQEAAGSQYDFPLDGPVVTNAEVFREYIKQYLNHREDIHKKDLSLLVRDLEPSDHGLPIEVYAFTKTTAWEQYEAIQSEIFNHLIAAAAYFDLRVFQQPSGHDLARIALPR